MKTPICELCAASGSLCNNCESRLSSGALSQLDVEVSRLLYKYRSHFSLDDVELAQILNMGRLVILVTSSDAGLLIGKKGRVVNALSKDLGMKIRIVQKTGDVKRMVEELLLPVRITGMNLVYKQGGEQEYRVRIHSQDVPRLPSDLIALEAALHKLTGQKISVALE
jgi:transcription antitermination factor NusA-like protein